MVEWRVSPGLVPYDEALAFMEARVAAIRAGQEAECVWLLEHPPLYTAGTSADPADLLVPERFPVHVTGRGGEYTYHGPGQRVVYVILDLAARGRDLRRFVSQLEQWIIAALAEFQVTGERRAGRVGVWVRRPDLPPMADGAETEQKIAAIGIRVRGWVSFHGFAINHDPDLSHFDGIVPCGLAGYGVTSLVDLGLPISMTDLDLALERSFAAIFPPGATAPDGEQGQATLSDI
ncbi:MAG: lipoyl(octanoyl) transferase LipB [Pseudomonadota bacterium]